ncbi:uncharacterized protein LOC107491053 [Arachis duranensis]|uniref:Uncharacterized protein LOC107491053 n=1 Tax=Arachis duranensis TaxID=130453 RepID=A0A6P4DF12_ARADU|nr:uncharacterized protein LOC107491053 [Arachis duranensis]
MPHRSTSQQQQLNLLAPPLSLPLPPPPPQPHPTSHHPTPNPDLTLPYYKPSFILKHLSNIAIAHKPPSPHKHSLPPTPPPPPPPSPPRLKSKALPSSSICDFSKDSIAVMRPPRNEKERNMPSKRAPSKEKLKKSQGEQERRKLDDSNGGVQFEDVKVVERHSVSLAPPPPSNNGCGGGRRRSFCGGSSKVDLGDVFAVNGVKVVSADMPPFMQIHAVDSARKAFDSMEKFTSKTLACTLKKEFDGVYGPAWHCIVGTNFGSFVTHSVGGFLYFSMDQKFYILLFKTTVQKTG